MQCPWSMKMFHSQAPMRGQKQTGSNTPPGLLSPQPAPMMKNRKMKADFGFSDLFHISRNHFDPLYSAFTYTEIPSYKLYEYRMGLAAGFGTFCGSLWVNISFSVPCARLSPD